MRSLFGIEAIRGAVLHEVRPYSNEGMRTVHRGGDRDGYVGLLVCSKSMIPVPVIRDGSMHVVISHFTRVIYQVFGQTCVLGNFFYGNIQ